MFSRPLLYTLLLFLPQPVTAMATSAPPTGNTADQAGCPTGTIPNREFFTLLGGSIPSENEGQNTGAASSLSASADVLTRPLFSRLLGFAIENDLAKVGQGSLLTLDLNVFAFVAVAAPDSLNLQEKYAAYQWLRRLGGQVSFGGKGEKVDQNGDGILDDPKQASALNDIISGELRWRIIGTHDTRDAAAFTNILDHTYTFQNKTLSIRDASAELNRGYADVFRDIINVPNAIERKSGCLWRDALDAFLTDPNVRQTLAALQEQVRAFDEALQQVVAAQGRTFLLTAAAGGTSRRQEFGADSYYGALRASVGVHSFEFQLSRRSPYQFLPSQISGRLAYELAVDVFRGTLLGSKGAKLSLAASYEHKNKKLLADEHLDIAQAAAKLEVSVTASIKVPLTIKVANHEDLLADMKTLSGHVGLSIDLGGFKKGK